MAHNPVSAEQQQDNDFQEFFESLNDLIDFCEEKWNQPTPGDIEYCQEHLHSSVQSLEYIEFYLTENNATSSLLEVIRTLLLSFHSISQAWNELQLGHAVPSMQATVGEFSRLIVYLSCSGNNRADTVLDLFLEATEKYGVPSRVRGDCGCENVLVAEFMENRRGYCRGSYIGGQSVHNSRIERLWRVVYYAVVQTFYTLFYYVESTDVLRIDNKNEVFCLHYVFISRINAALKEFTEAYNHHGVGTEHGWSPCRMWVNGMINAERQNSIAVGDVMNFTDIQTFGIDPSEVYINEESIPVVQIPEVGLQMTESQPEDILNSLRLHCDPLSYSQEFGIDIYLFARQNVDSLLQES